MSRKRDKFRMKARPTAVAIYARHPEAGTHEWRVAEEPDVVLTVYEQHDRTSATDPLPGALDDIGAIIVILPTEEAVEEGLLERVRKVVDKMIEEGDE